MHPLRCVRRQRGSVRHLHLSIQRMSRARGRILSDALFDRLRGPIRNATDQAYACAFPRAPAAAVAAALNTSILARNLAARAAGANADGDALHLGLRRIAKEYCRQPT